MKTDKVTVMNKGTKASGGKKARKRPTGLQKVNAIGALMKHKDKTVFTLKQKRIKHVESVEAGDKKRAAKHDADSLLTAGGVRR